MPAALHGPWQVLAFVAAASLHAASHALVALVGSVLALSLTMYGATPASVNEAAPRSDVAAGDAASRTRAAARDAAPLRFATAGDAAPRIASAPFASLARGALRDAQNGRNPALGTRTTAKAPSASADHRAPAIGVVLGWLARRGDPPTQALWLAAIGLIIVLLKGATGAYATFVQVLVAGRIGCGLRLEIFDALLDVHRLRHPRHADQGSRDRSHAASQAACHPVSQSPGPVAHAIVAMTERVRDVELGLGQGLLGTGRAVAQLLPLVALLAVLSPGMAGVGAAVLVGFGWTLGRLRKALRAAARRAAREHEGLVAAADECVRHADLWVTYGAEGRARVNVRALGDAAARGSARLAGGVAVLSAANEGLAAVALVVALGAAHAGWLGAGADGATLFAFAVAFFLAYRPLRELAEARAAYARAQVAFADLLPMLAHRVGDLRPTRDAPSVDRADAADRSSSRLVSSSTPASILLPSHPNVGSRDTVRRARRWALAELELCELRVARGALDLITLRVPPGAIAVVTGPTGVGKTTLLRTLLGLEAARGGEVLYSGEPLVHAPAGPFTRPFAWVPQDAPLLDATLATNIDLGAPGVDARAMLAPLGAGHLFDALRGRRLGPAGHPPSGGERQWIALARAMATRQPVLLLDEPTSGLDPEAQAVVLEAIARLRGERTVILVTHRSEPVGIADMVVNLSAERNRRQDRIAG